MGVRMCGDCARRSVDGACGVELMDDWDAPSYSRAHSCHTGKFKVNSWRRQKRWTEAELDAVRKLYPTCGAQAVAVTIGRCPEMVYQKARALGVKRERGKGYDDRIR